jgi:hypothetical protein
MFFIVGPVWLFDYIPPPNQWGDSLQVLSYVFDDHKGDLIIPNDIWHSPIDVIPINDAPQFIYNGAAPSQYIEVNTSLPLNTPLTYNLSVIDPGNFCFSLFSSLRGYTYYVHVY